MNRKTQQYVNPYYRRRNAADGKVSTVGALGNFWGNFKNITESMGGLFSDVSSGTASIINAQNTKTTNNNDNTKTDAGVYIFVGIGILLLVVILVFAFAFNRR